MSHRTFVTVLIILALIGVVIGADLSLIHVRQITHPGSRSFCSWSESFNCDTVARSSWAEILGVPIAFLGVLFYLFVILLSVLGSVGAFPNRILGPLVLLLGFAGFHYSVVLAYVSYDVIRSVCILCSGLYLINFLIFILSIAYLRHSPVSEVAEAIRAGREMVAGRPWKSLGLVLLLVPFAAAAEGTRVWVRALRAEAATQSVEQAVVTLGPEKMKLLYGAVPPPASQLTIVEFADFECPHCRDFSLSLHEALKPFDDRVRVVFKNFPLDTACNSGLKVQIHPRACDLAVAARCAGQQGRFWPYYNLLFQNQYAQDPASLMAYAMKVGVDVDAFAACLRDPSNLEAVKSDIGLGRQLGLAGVPAIVIKDKMYLGAMPPEELRALIAQNLPPG